jgi:uncharacterized repeat protein (TIGR01451 family)
MTWQRLSSVRGPGLRVYGLAIAALSAVVALVVVGSGSAPAAVGATDLALTKTDTPDPVRQGETLTYTIRVENTGANDATNVVVADTLASQLKFVSATASQGDCDKVGRVVTCNLGQLNAGQTATVTIKVKPNKAGPVANTAVVSSPQDTTPQNNRDTTNTQVRKKKAPPVGPTCRGVAATILGTPGNDSIEGTPGRDVIVAFAGRDVIFSRGGKDLVCGNRGADVLVGGLKADSLIGGKGPDRVIGSSGADVLRGKQGRDRLRGKKGADFLDGGTGVDSCKGGPGRDRVKRCP